MNLPQMTDPTKFIDDISTPSSLANILKLKKQMTIQAILEEEDGYIFKKILIPELTKSNEAHLKQISVTLASNLIQAYTSIKLY